MGGAVTTLSVHSLGTMCGCNKRLDKKPLRFIANDLATTFQVAVQVFHCTSQL